MSSRRILARSFAAQRVSAAPLSSPPPARILLAPFASPSLHRSFSASSSIGAVTAAQISPTSAGSAPPPPPPPPNSSKPRKSLLHGVLRISLLALKYLVAPVLLVIAGYASTRYAMAAVSAPAALHPAAPASPASTDPATPPALDVDTALLDIPLVRQLRADPAWIETRPHDRIPDAFREHNLTAGPLAGPRRLTVVPIMFSNETTNETVGVFHLGRDLCGHPGIVHGGMLATILDESLVFTAFPVLPSHVGVTASLSINYRAPAYADNFYALKGHVEKHEGRKAWVHGHIETIPTDGKPPVTVAEAELLVVEPKWAKSLPNFFTT
ncbi:HotDog domain-containing protein [Limtongia smithiae]|uniref:HotDog domain-containing protein n=1 Tax=Limtongia smithiae TaxID=1125753 RepID=UPI0034CD6BBE